MFVIGPCDERELVKAFAKVRVRIRFSGWPPLDLAASLIAFGVRAVMCSSVLAAKIGIKFCT
jgi:hypothetical protein